MQPEFDVIVVGAGLGGSATAITLARKGANVLVLEKARIPGERNMSGGVLLGLIQAATECSTSSPTSRRMRRSSAG